jgi:hypothetical protein
MKSRQIILRCRPVRAANAGCLDQAAAMDARRQMRRRALRPQMKVVRGGGSVPDKAVE